LRFSDILDRSKREFGAVNRASTVGLEFVFLAGLLKGCIRRSGIGVSIILIVIILYNFS
jgi:hypothetical protein